MSMFNDFSDGYVEGRVDLIPSNLRVATLVGYALGSSGADEDRRRLERDIISEVESRYSTSRSTDSSGVEPEECTYCLPRWEEKCQTSSLEEISRRKSGLDRDFTIINEDPAMCKNCRHSGRVVELPDAVTEWPALKDAAEANPAKTVTTNEQWQSFSRSRIEHLRIRHEKETHIKETLKRLEGAPETAAFGLVYLALALLVGALCMRFCFGPLTEEESALRLMLCGFLAGALTPLSIVTALMTLAITRIIKPATIDEETLAAYETTLIRISSASLLYVPLAAGTAYSTLRFT